MSFSSTYSYTITDESLFLGFVHNPLEDYLIILGPVSMLPFSSNSLHKMLRTYELDEKSYTQLEEYFLRTPSFSFNQLLSILSIVHKELNGTFIDIQKIYLETSNLFQTEVAIQHSHSLFERKEIDQYHNTYYFEQEYYDFVERGDVEGLSSFLRHLPPITEGSIASDYVRQSKNIFIASITLITRHSIAGGLDIETAYQLSDSYIQKMEKMNNAAAIGHLGYSAVHDFTRRVADAKIPQGMSPAIFHSIQYISNHVNQPISVEQIAASIPMDRSTLSKKFKKELGFNISRFIIRRKLEEAKTLLRYTDKTISEISEYLCFSSQSYFQNVFKRQYGVTPRDYRLQNK